MKKVLWLGKKATGSIGLALHRCLIHGEDILKFDFLLKTLLLDSYNYSSQKNCDNFLIFLYYIFSYTSSGIYIILLYL